MIKLTEQKSLDYQIPYFTPLEQLEFIPGIWVNGKCFWLQHSGEKILYDEEIIVKVKQEHVHSKISFYNLYVSNHSSVIKDIKILAMYHYSYPSSDQFSFVSPTENVIFQLADRKIYMINGHCNGEGITEYTNQPFWNVFTDRIWHKQDKGALKYQPMARGHSASILAMKMFIHPHETANVSTWCIRGTDKNELIFLDKALKATRKE